MLTLLPEDQASGPRLFTSSLLFKSREGGCKSEREDREFAVFSDCYRNSKPIVCSVVWRGRQGSVIFSGSYRNSKPRKCVCSSDGEDSEVVVFLTFLTVILSLKSVCQLCRELPVSTGFHDRQYSQHLTLATPLCCKVMSGYVRQASSNIVVDAQPGNQREF